MNTVYWLYLLFGIASLTDLLDWQLCFSPLVGFLVETWGQLLPWGSEGSGCDIVVLELKNSCWIVGTGRWSLSAKLDWDSPDHWQQRCTAIECGVGWCSCFHLLLFMQMNPKWQAETNYNKLANKAWSLYWARKGNEGVGRVKWAGKSSRRVKLLTCFLFFPLFCCRLVPTLSSYSGM